MKNRMRCVVLVVGCLFSFAAAAAGKRVALVVGITDYPGVDRLDAAVLDAKLISQHLRAIGFDVTESRNGTYRRLNEDIADFADAASGAEVALFYYAGHGFEVGGENFLMPTDIGKPMAGVDRDTVRLRGLPLSTVLREINAASPKALVAVIDACRDAPSRGGQSRGFTAPDVGDGTFIAYSTRPGERAIDSAASLGHAKRNSPFALYFAENLAQPNLGLLALMEATQSQVDSFTQGRQRPWFSSALKGPVVLHAQAPAAAASSSMAGMLGGVGSGGNARGSASMCPPDRAEASRLWNSEMRAVEADAMDLTAARVEGLRSRAQAGEPRAKAALGLAYDRGSVVGRDHVRAVRYWQEAAEGGYVIAQTLLGEALYEGDTRVRDRNRARKWLEKASNAGFARATLDLAAIHDDNAGAAAHLMVAFCQGIQGFNP